MYQKNKSQAHTIILYQVIPIGILRMEDNMYQKKVQVIEIVVSNTPYDRLEREDFWIKKLATKIPLKMIELIY
jgi:hypothetical protein